MIAQCWYMTAQYKKVEEKEIKNVKLKVIQFRNAKGEPRTIGFQNIEF